MDQQKTEIPQWATAILDSHDVEKINAAILHAELKTTGEIVPMIVRSSITTGHVLPISFLLFWLAISGLGHEFMNELGLQPWQVTLGAFAWALAFAFLFHRSRCLARWLTPKSDQSLSVGRRALLEFHVSGIPATSGRTGVLILISLLERRVVVLGDEAIAKKVKPEMWDKIIDDILPHFGRKDFSAGLCAAIEHAGELLAREFPAVSHDTHELPTCLLLKD